MGDYTIQGGDCLWNIAKMQYGSELKTSADIRKAVEKLAEVNNIENPNLIYAGNTLQIPDVDSIFTKNADESALLDVSNIEDEPTGTVLDTSGVEDEPTGTVLDLSQYVNKPQGRALDITEGENEPTGTVLDLSQYVNKPGDEAKGGNLYEKFNEWTLENTKDFYENGLIKDPEALRAGYDEIEGRVFDFNKQGSQNPRQDGVLELAEGEINRLDSSNDNYIDLNEYIQGSIDEANDYYTDYELTLDAETRQGLEASFEFFDFNHDNKLEKNEIAAYYNLVDSSDGAQDGRFTFKQYGLWGQIAQTKGDTWTYYKNMLDNLFKESYPSQA